MRCSKVHQIMLTLSLALLLICGLCFANPLPIDDISSTTLGISGKVIDTHTERIAVTITRTDDLVEDNGELVAHRSKSIVFNFNIRDNVCDMNGAPIDLNLKSVQVVKVNAVFMPANNATMEKLDEIESEFDTGLVTAQVKVSVQNYPSPAPEVTLRKIMIQTTVVEINGETIVESETTEKVLELQVHQNGALESLPSGSIGDDGYISPFLFPRPVELGSHVPHDKFLQDEHHPKHHHTLTKTKLVAIFAGTAILTFLAVLFVEFLVGCFGSRKYQAVSLTERADENDHVEDEKSPFPPEYAEKLPLIEEEE